jgi:hypothetical protein
MAARKTDKLDQRWRDRISTSMLINRLNKVALGQLEVSPIQLRAMEIALKKTVPDLSASELEVTENRPYAVIPQENPSVTDWERKVAETTVLGPEAKVKH